MLTIAQQKREQDKKDRAIAHWQSIIADGYMQCRVCKLYLQLCEFTPCNNIAKRSGYLTYNTECKSCRKQRHFNDRHFVKITLKDVLLEKLYKSKIRANNKNLEFDLDLEFLLYLWEKQKGKCYYTNRDLSLIINDQNKLSIDRIDSSKGYVKNNVVLCCNIVNYIKLDLSENDFSKIIIELYNNYCLK